MSTDTRPARPELLELTTIQEIESLPVGSVVRTRTGGYVMERLSDGWYQPVIVESYIPNRFWLPALLLWTPEWVTEHERLGA